MFRRIARLAGAVALSAGVVAVPVGAALAAPSYVDTSLQASGFTGASQQTTCSAPVSAAVAGSGTKTMSFTARGASDTFSAATFSQGAGGTATAAISTNGTFIQVTGVSGTTTSADTLKFKITSGGCTSVETASITEVAGSLTETDSLDVVVLSASPQSFAPRSEERRVGKERRPR